MIVFFTTWMTATTWVAGITVCVGAIGFSRLVSAWAVALGVLAARWVWLWRGGRRESAAAAASEVYPGSLDAGLT
eukprot:6675001-Prymnesium_polylepis.1